MLCLLQDKFVLRSIYNYDKLTYAEGIAKVKNYSYPIILAKNFLFTIRLFFVIADYNSRSDYFIFVTLGYGIVKQYLVVSMFKPKCFIYVVGVNIDFC